MENQGYTYIITCIHPNEKGKSFVGQTTKVESNTMENPVRYRFSNHVSEATLQRSSGCRKLNEAIRKYGRDYFIVDTIDTIPKEELDHYEDFYINKYQTLHPDGYNLKTGGQSGSKYCKESRKLISDGQTGNRRKKKERKFDDDGELPKNIISLRNSENKVVGYMMNGFPIGKRKYISKKFLNDFLTLDEKLMLSKQCIKDHQKKYETDLNKIKEKRVKDGKIDHEIGSLDYELPDYVDEIIDDDEVVGYSVRGNGKIRKFNKKGFLYENLKNAMIYGNKLKQGEIAKNFVPPFDPELEWRDENNTKLLPKYVSYDKKDGIITGYFINNYRFKHTSGERKGQVERIKKRFCDQKQPIDQKYNDCINYLKQLLAGNKPD